MAGSAMARRLVTVQKDGDLQAALDRALPGDVIALAPGAVFRGSFTLPKTGTAEWITIRSGPDDATLPPAGTRIGPRHAPALAVIEAPGSAPAIRTAPGAHHIRLVGLHVRPAAGVHPINLIALGTADETDVAALPHHIVIERCYIHGDPGVGGRRGVALNARAVAIVDSYFADWKAKGQDSQAIAGWNGPGPFTIMNNYLEGAGENVMFGGAAPAIAGLVPADIQIRGNHLAKPARWNRRDPSWDGSHWAVKNLFELKNASRVVIDGNVFENTWEDAQTGFAILFTVRGEDGRAPWATVSDVVFTNNLVRHAGGGMNFLGHDSPGPSGRTERIVVRNNLFTDIGGPRRGGGRLFQLLDGTVDVLIDHNTGLATGHVIAADGAPPHAGFVFTNNIVSHNEFGVFGSGAAVGTPTLAQYFPGARFTRNVVIGGPSRSYPAGNFFPASTSDVGFTDPARGHYGLVDSSRYRHAATDGTAIGVDVTTLATAETAARGAEPALFAAVTSDGPRASTSTVTVTIARHAFWLSVALLGYVYVGYPALVVMLARRIGPTTAGGQVLPRVTVIVVAHNEEARIGRRIDNLLALDYPRERLEIIVASDGSTDATVTRARDHAAAGVRIIEFATRRGKAAVLEDVVTRAAGEVIVFADARQAFERGAVAHLVSRFADPDVGAVSGELMLAPPASGSVVGSGIGAYWRYEKLIRSAESAIDSTVGATGAIYAVRRDLVEVIPRDTILDDVLIPLRVVRAGYRVVFEPAARAWDHATDTARDEFTRKVRTIAGNFQLFGREARWLFNPRRNRIIIQTISHKGLRLLSPLLVGVAFITNAAAATGPLYRSLFVAQLVFYAAALAGHAASRARRRIGLLGVPYVFCLLNWATVVAFLRILRGRQSVTWEQAMTNATERSAAEPA